jgi:hypothetical protein
MSALIDAGRALVEGKGATSRTAATAGSRSPAARPSAASTYADRPASIQLCSYLREPPLVRALQSNTLIKLKQPRRRNNLAKHY